MLDPAVRKARAASTVVALLLVLAGLCGCDPGTASPADATASSPADATGSFPADAAGSSPTAAPPTSPAGGSAADGTGAALDALAAIPVKGRAPRTGYSRDAFGSGWVDTDHNGCDTRNDVLARDLTGETFKPGTHDCVVLTGVLADPYSGRTIAFRRGAGTSDDVQIDHVVALSDAWQKGAQSWDADRRAAFANDPLNLLAVDGPLNDQKGDGDAATWLPPNRAFRCAYVARQVAVKLRYGLWMTRAEKNAAATVLGGCPTEPLRGDVVATAPVAGRASTPAATVPPAAGVEYRNCDAVRAAGAAPIHPGDPGWRDAFDRDHDGVGCDG